MQVPLLLASALGLQSVADTPVTRAAVQNALTGRTTTTSPRPNPKSGAGTRISAGLIEDIDQNVDLRGEKWYGRPGKIGIAGKMLRDPHVGQTIDALISVLVSGKWRFKSASDDTLDREVADFCNWSFFECLPWSRVLRGWVKGYVTNGFHLSEMLDDNRPVPASRFPGHPGAGTGIVPTAFRDLAAWTVFDWIQSERDPAMCEGVVQWIQGSDAEPADFPFVGSERFLRMTWDQEGANFEGFATLRRAYQPWKIKMALLTINAMDHERTGMGTPSITLPEEADEEDIAAAEEILAEMRSNEKGYIILPFGYVFEWNVAATSQKDAIEKAFTRLNIDIAHNMAQGFMLLGLQGKAGSFALGGTQQGQFHLQSVAQAKFVCDSVNVGPDGWSPAERIVRLNYGPDVGLPILECRNLPTRNWLDVARTYANGVQTGALTADDATEDELREAMELGPRDRSMPRREVGLAAPGGEDEPGESDDQDESEEDETDEG